MTEKKEGDSRREVLERLIGDEVMKLIKSREFSDIQLDASGRVLVSEANGPVVKSNVSPNDARTFLNALV